MLPTNITNDKAIVVLNAAAAVRPPSSRKYAIYLEIVRTHPSLMSRGCYPMIQLIPQTDWIKNVLIAIRERSEFLPRKHSLYDALFWVSASLLNTTWIDEMNPETSKSDL